MRGRLGRTVKTEAGALREGNILFIIKKKKNRSGPRSNGGRQKGTRHGNKERPQKPTIELRYYELPEHEPALALLGPEWQRVYGTEPEDLHFHNLMEIGLCQWGEGTLIVDETRYIYHGG